MCFKKETTSREWQKAVPKVPNLGKYSASNQPSPRAMAVKKGSEGAKIQSLENTKIIGLTPAPAPYLAVGRG